MAGAQRLSQITGMGFHRTENRGQRLQARDAQQKRLLSPRNQFAQLQYIPKALRLVWTAAPYWTTATAGLLLVQGTLPVLSVYLTRAVVNSLATAIQNPANTAAWQPALFNILWMGLVLLAGEIFDSLSVYIRQALAEQVQDHLRILIHAKAISLDLQFYESPAYYDQLQRASIDAIDRPLALVDNLGSLLQNTITLAAMAGVLLAFVWWIPLALLAGTLPALWVALRAAWKYQRWRLENTMNQRYLAYYNYTLSSEAAAAELRLFDLGAYFAQAHQNLRRKLRRERLRLTGDQLLGQIGASLIGLLTLALSTAWMAWRALQGAFNLGDLAMFYQAMSQGQRLMRSLLNGASEIYRNLLFLDDLFIFLDLQPLLKAARPPATLPTGLKQGVCLKSVTFSYPDSERTALSNFSLQIPAGRIVAIVGENGAGKSTLVKLLCRFYDPQQGCLTWDGIDLRHIEPVDLRRRITVLFQKSVPYHDTAAHNIAFGDLAAGPTQEEIEAAARSAAADTIVHHLPQGYETVLGRWFGYTNLSEGEWQRLALARAFVRRADLVILDEPTSAMDSWAEARWLDRFRDLVQGRTALIITHRFTTARQADVIYVMQEGQLVEAGSHDELLALNGRYAASWREQQREVSPDRYVPVEASARE